MHEGLVYRRQIVKASQVFDLKPSPGLAAGAGRGLAGEGFGTTGGFFAAGWTGTTGTAVGGGTGAGPRAHRGRHRRRERSGLRCRVRLRRK